MFGVEVPDGPPPPLGRGLGASEIPEAVVQRGLLRAMLLSRTLETRTVELYRQNRVTGGCYTGIGNEATSVGTAWSLGDGDILVPTHRDMGSHLVRGHTPLQIMRQYMKRSTAMTGGKDSSLHLGAEGTDIVGMISPLAHMMPVACGAALAERQRGNICGVLTTVGDGSTSLGDFHEALNFAAVQKLPVLFVIVNNQYAYSTPPQYQYACEKLSDRAMGYGMVGETVDGTDVLRVLEASRRAMARAKAGEGPTLLECVTMRMRGHSEHDDHKYVPSECLEAWRGWDPVTRMVSYAESEGIVTAAELTELRAEVLRDVDAAIELAEADPAPEPASAGEGVFRHWSSGWTVPMGDLR